MSGKVLGILKIERKEIGLLLLMFIQAGFIGIFIGGFDISMHAIYLSYFNPVSISKVYLYSGIAGILIMGIYTYFSTRFPFRFFILLNYIIVFLLTVIILFFVVFIPHEKFVSAGFALMFPLNIMIFLNFWRAQREILKPVQTKRLSVILQFAFYGGIVFISYGTILFLFVSSELYIILAISCLCLFLGIIFQIFINIFHRNSPVFLHSPKKINPIRSKFFELFYTRYTVLLVAFVVLSSVAGYLLHFNFINSTRLNYPSIVGFTKFIGLFSGSLFLFIFFVDKVFIRKLLYSYDSPFSLFLIPVVLIIFLIVSLGIYYTIGTERIIARFSFFFLIVAMIKTVYELSKYDVEIPSFKVLFQTLDVRFHGTIIPRVDGTLRCVGIALSGLLLIGVTKLNLINSIYLNILTLIITIGWLVVAFYLIKSYKSALQGTIKRFRSSKKSGELLLKAADEKLHLLINHKSPKKVMNSLLISERIEPVSFEKHIINFIKDNSPVLQEFAFNKIDEKDLIVAYPDLKNLKPAPDGSNIKGIKLAERFEQKISLGKTVSQIERLAGSKNINDRVLAANLIGYLNKKELSSVLINLSRDFEPEVKQASVRVMARVAFSETCHTLIGFLNSSTFYPFAFEALVKIGDDALDHLERLFDAPDSDNLILSRIVKVYGKIGTSAAIECLLSKIENQNRFIARQSIRALREARFQAAPGNINRIFNMVVRTINTMSWNFSALSSLEESKSFMLKNAVQSELEDNYKMLFHLMALAYNSNSIANIQKLVDEGSDTDISFAIELLDMIVLEEVKQVLFPVLENLSVKSRVKQLQYFFQNENYSNSELVPEIIVRDFNQISIYTKACAIYNWKFPVGVIPDILIANLFHPNKLISETSAYIIHKINPDFLETVYPRLSYSGASDIKSSLANISAKADFLLLDKVEFLKKCKNFVDVPEEILYEVALRLKVNMLNSGQQIVINGYHIGSLIFVYDGEIEVYAENGEQKIFTKNDLFYTDIYIVNQDNSNGNIKAGKDTVLFSLEKNVLDMLMFDYSEFRFVLLELIETATD